jgi:hypothetical protein
MYSYSFIDFSYIFFIENTIHTAILYLYIYYILLINYINLIMSDIRGKCLLNIFLTETREYIRSVYFSGDIKDIRLELA